ncbi:hypothetical protein [Streptomyces sp. NPDC059874]|uniref:hypothetical protein n=1 Tax=Streptomyces sp. NPDC059874 TaxID=3346983 RepID=UPI0036524079
MSEISGSRAAVLEELRAAVAAHPLVNLAGPLGVGKSRLAAALQPALTVDLDRPRAVGTLRRAQAAPVDRLLVVDSAEGPRRLAAVREALGAAANLLVVSRRPVLADAGWADSGAVTVTVTVPPLPDDELTAGMETAEGRDLAVRLGGGLPLLAQAVGRALRAGIPPSATGAVADHVATEILERLGKELPGRRPHHTLRLLATVWNADEKLLSGGPELFTALAELSIVARGRLGLGLAEPFRHVIELAYRWRQPQAHEAVRTRAARYRLALLDRSEDPVERGELVEQGIFLTGDPLLRQELFPAAERSSLFRTAADTDAGAIGRLMREWAVSSGFDPRRADRLAERWAADDISAFHLARDADGRPVGLASLLPIGERTMGSTEPLLQQHSDELTAGGLFLGAAYCPDPAVHAQLLRHILRQAVGTGRLVVSTASPGYQALLGGLEFRNHGGIGEDVYRCGRPPEVFSNDFAPNALPRWLARLAGGPVQDVTAHLAKTLSRIRDPQFLARSPLLALPRTPTVESLRGWLYDAVHGLALSADEAESEAGRILQAYYFGRAGTHHQVARGLHLSRATYFRRLRHGLDTLGARLQSPVP